MKGESTDDMCSRKCIETVLHNFFTIQNKFLIFLMFITRFFGVLSTMRSYIAGFKLKVVEHAKLYGAAAGANECDVTQRIVQKWKNMKEKLETYKRTRRKGANRRSR